MTFSTALAAGALSIALVLNFFHPAYAQETLSPQDAFKRGNELTATNRVQEAIPFYLIAYNAHPEDDAVVWNLGIASAQVGDNAQALKYWTQYQKLRPDDWHGHAKLIQTYQALGDADSRDRMRAALFELRRAAPVGSDLASAEMYCREQMEIAGKKVLAFEAFEPKGERMVFYKFVITKPDGTENFRLSLGSYDATNQIAWQVGSVPKDQRVYHLDQYQGPNHQTYGFFRSQPSYEVIRAQVDAILNGHAEPSSGTRRN